MKNWIFFVIGALLAFFLVLMFPYLFNKRLGAVQVDQQVCFCHNVVHNPHTICTSNQGQINGHTTHVNNGTDTFGECVVEPTVTPTPTEEVTPTPDVTPSPEVTPTPTEEPRPTPTETLTTSTQSTQTAQTPLGGEPVCTIGIEAPLLQGFDVTSDTSVFWHWWPSKSNISKQWIEYGYEKGNYPYSVFIPTDATGYEIGALQRGLVRWARIGVSDEQGCVAFSNDLDP